MKRGILVFLKFPDPGKVKTRLAEGIGSEEATVAYCQLTCRVLEQVKAANPDLIAVAFDPPEKEAEIRAWLDPWLAAFPGEIRWFPQADGNLGDRLKSAVSAVLDEEAEIKLAVVGSDCVGLDKAVWEEVWQRLGGANDIVFGPSADGGYYLLGLTEAHGFLFDGIPWSSEETLQVSLTVANEAGLVSHLLPKRRDVDTLADWEAVASEVSGRRCLFFDRDGVVNQSPGPGYVLRWEDFHLNEGIADSIRWLKERDWLVILVTSQKGVGKRLMSSDDLDEIHFSMQRDLARSEAMFDAIYAFTGEPDCPHQPKPDPEMIHSAVESFYIDPRQSWMVGDADRDIEMARAAGLAGTIRILSDKPVGTSADHTLEAISGLKSLFERVL